MCDANAGPYRVVPDTSALAFSTLREAGQFYLRQGQNVVVLNHYLLIQNQYPQFLNPPGVPITGSRPESVHIFEFVFVYLGACTLPCDLAIAKRASRDTAQTGEELHYQLLIGNNGPHTGRRIHIFDHLPPEVQQVQYRPSPDSVSALTAHWCLDSLDVGQVFTIGVSGVVVDSLVDSMASITNRAAVSAINDTNAANDSAEVTVLAVQRPVVQACDLAVRKVADADTLVAGEVVTYTLTLTNLGPGPVRQGTLLDTLAGFITPLSFAPEPDSFAQRVAFWRLAEMAPGQQQTIRIQARISPRLPETPFVLVNRAHVDADSDTDRTNDLDTAVTVVLPQPCQVWVRKSASSDTVEAGSLFTYQLAVGNLGPGSAYRVAVVDTLPAMMTVTDFGMAPDSMRGRVAWWWFDSLAAGEERAWWLWVQVDSQATGPLWNVLTAHAPGERDPGDDEARKRVIVRPRPVTPTVCHVRVVKRADRDSVMAGGRVSYGLEVSNAGPGVARQVVVVDSLPVQVRVREFSWAPDEVVGGSLVWRLDSLGVGEVVGIGVVVEVDSPLVGAPVRLLNVAVVSAVNDTTRQNDADSAAVIAEQPIPVERRTDLALSKWAEVDSVRPGEHLTFTLHVQNLGPVASEQGWLEDLLPEEVTVVGHSITPDSLTGTRATWRLPVLAPGGTYQVALRLLVVTELAPEVTRLQNTAFLSVPNDSNLANDWATVSVDVRRGASASEKFDLSVQKLATRDTVAVSQSFMYQIVVRNHGPGTATEVVLTEVLPGGLQVEDFVPPPDSIAGNVLVWRIAVLPPGQEAQVMFAAVVGTAPEHYPAELVNTCSVQAEGDTMAANDVSRARVVVTATTSDCEAFYFDQNLFEPDRGTPLTIFFGLPARAEVSLDLYDVTGYHVTRIVKDTFGTGMHAYLWDGRTEHGDKVGSGVYVIALRTGKLICWKKVIVLR